MEQGASLLAGIVPAEVATAECFSDPPEAALLPEEEPLVARAVAKRRAEFTTGRHCARQALAKLGFSAQPILAGEKREPLWPEGVVGSITHCAGYRGAAVARTDALRALGIDAEPHEPLPPRVLEAVSLPEERQWIAELAERVAGDSPQAPLHADKLVFAAKEALYKAWFPLTGRWLGFGDAAISLGPKPGQFTAEIRVNAPVIDGHPCPRWKGKWRVERGLVLAAVTVQRG